MRRDRYWLVLTFGENQIISSNLFSRTTSVLYVGKYNRSRERSGNVLIRKDRPELSSDSLIRQYILSLFVDLLVEFNELRCLEYTDI